MAPRILLVDDNRELLNLLAQLLEETGYEVLKAERGRTALELAREHAPQLAILDVLLPDLSGFQVAEALAKQDPTLPLIFMTGVFKGGRHSQDARVRFRSLAYFEKPFEAQKLLEKVAQAVRPQPSPQRAVPSFQVEQEFDVEEDGPPDAMELTGRIKVTGLDNLAAELRGRNLTARGHGFGARPRPEDEEVTAPEGRIRRGRVADNLPSLITAYYLARETGELGLQKGKVKKSILFEKGQPVFAYSNLLSDRFGQFLVRVGKVKAEQLQDAVQVAGTSQRRTGDVLIERGLLQENERLYYVGQQVKAIIYSLFAWEEGEYVMTFEASPDRETIRLDVHPANLIARGVKKLYKAERLLRLVPAESKPLPSAQPAYALSDVDLEKWEAQLLPKVDGTRTVAELAAQAGRPLVEVQGFVAAMAALTLLEFQSHS